MKFFLPGLIFIFLLVNGTALAQPVIALTPCIEGLNLPIQLVNAGDGSKRVFVVQKGGTVLVYDKHYAFLDTFLVINSGISTGGEGGLLSVAFHPAYAANGFFYAYYTNGGGDLELARYMVGTNSNKADPASKVIVKTIPHPNNANHNGGELHFGTDGYLYLSTGDGGGGGDVANNAQNENVLLGKILRFEVRETPPYFAIPPGNPFKNEVVATGLRNPFRWGFDRLTQDMWIGDVGQDGFEEINFRPSDAIVGANYGWRCYEANTNYNTSVGCNQPISNYTFPVYAYPTQNPSAAITGGTVYRGNTYIGLRGFYVAADFYSGTFYLIKLDTVSHTWQTFLQTLPITGICDFGESEEGELYGISLITNKVYRIASSGPLAYTFTGDGNWSEAGNWINNMVPPDTLPATSEIIIDPVINGACILNVPQTIANGAKITIQPGKQFKINGNLLIF